ncbi:MAG: hypothetical protein WC375_03635 [Methanomassiliicoccales archaeon]|jgi:hypothetical protein
MEFGTNMQNTLYKFAKSIKDLYCETRLDSIGLLFRRYASTYELNLSKWIRQHGDITEQLSDPDVYRSLVLLAKLREENPSGVTANQMVKFFTDNRSALSVLPIILAFLPLLQSDVEGLLAPYSDIIHGCSVFTAMKSTVDSSTVASDLRKINQLFMDDMSRENGLPSMSITSPTKKESKEQLKGKMFVELLKRFSSDMSSAAVQIGMNEFAKQLVTNGAIIKPDILNQYIRFSSPSPYMWNQSKRIIKELYKNIDKLDWAYEHAKEKSLHFAGVISSNELIRLYDQRANNINFGDLINNPKSVKGMADIDASYPKITPKADQWLNQYTISMVYALLTMLYEDIR